MAIQKSMKTKIPNTLLIFTLLLLPSLTFSQKLSKVDSIRAERLKVKVSIIEKSGFAGLIGETEVNELSNGICLLNLTDKKKANDLIGYLTGSLKLDNGFISKLFLNGSECFDEEQTKLVRTYLENHLSSEDKYFYELVSLYKLRSFSNELKAKIHTKDLKGTIQAELKKGKLYRKLKHELKSISTLANIENGDGEEDILNLLKSFHEFYLNKNDSIGYYYFYSQVLPNTLGVLYSKNAIIKSTYFLGATIPNVLKNHDDIAALPYPADFYYKYIQPRLNTYKFEVYFLYPEQYDINDFIEAVKGDNSIWKKHVRLK